jgi:hypothetical protein
LLDVYYYGGNLKSKKNNKTGSKKGSKSGLLPSSYQSLTDDEKAQVNAAFLAYKQNYPKDPYLIVDQFYYHIYRKGNWFAGTNL